MSERNENETQVINSSGSNYQDNTTIYTQQNTQYEYDQQPQGSNVFAIVSLILGIASIVLCCCIQYGSAILGIAGIICSIMAKKRSRSSLATAGLVCSIIGTVFGVIMLIIAISLEMLGDAFWANFENLYNNYLRENGIDFQIDLDEFR
ncbi:MAG: DUF4190 domain-containing protein [Lachnospiraceae bacterium]|jgi:hypothetical protein|nr:DUF4190 domain-containing protein [Lachnospiraceae bacterium]